jgi:hypothetical protein
MTPAQLRARDAANARRSRATAENPTYRLDDLDRWLLGVMAWMGLWPKQHLADCFGVSRKTVHNCLRQHFPQAA